MRKRKLIPAALAVGGAILVLWAAQRLLPGDSRIQSADFSGATEEAAENDTQANADGENNAAEEATEAMAQGKATEALAWEGEYERIRNAEPGDIVSAGILSPEFSQQLFYGSDIDETVFQRMDGRSYTQNENISISDLVYLRMLYYGLDGNTHVGEMVVNRKIETAVLRIFRELYEQQYPIERMVLIDAYDAQDERSMEENNTSAFNYRTISGSSRLSNHSYGMAIDLNPRYNPYVKTAEDGSTLCQPENGREYVDRSGEFPCKIDEEDLAYQLFTQEGFTWGGSWSSVKDYQHFEMEE